MRFEGEGKLLRIFIGESDRHGGKPLSQAIVELARREGLAGATVLRGVEGFGASSHLHTARILRLSQDLPVVIEIVDTAENVDRVLPLMDELVGDGMMTLERVEVVTYRAQRTAEPLADRLHMLAQQARTIVAEGGDPMLLTPSLRAAREYGASEQQIADAVGLPAERVRALLEGGGSEP
jgi:PII-like signaling protein